MFMIPNFTSRSSRLARKFLTSHANIRRCSNNKNSINPFERAFKILGNDIKNFKDRFTNKAKENINDLTYDSSKFGSEMHCDVLIIGGGAMGSSIAYWLKKKARGGLNVYVIEKDPTYQQASTVLSVGGLRQQFSLPENIQMSLYGAKFIQNAKEYLGDVELNFMPHGYLTLASDDGAEVLRKNSILQNELGALNELLSPERLKLRFPWLETDGIALGCHGLEKEGWFDPWALLIGFKRKAQEYGANFVDGELVDFEYTTDSDIIVEGGNEDGHYEKMERGIVKLPNGEKRSIKFAICIIAAGANSGKVGKLAKIGTSKGLLALKIPIEQRKRYVYVCSTQGDNSPGRTTPLVVDPNGTYFRQDGLGGNYLCGKSPDIDNEPPIDNLDVDEKYFENSVWPSLSRRVKAFESIKVNSSWAGFYDYNYFDENGIIGPHPCYHNIYIAAGFSGHGIQQAPAVGRAISELIIDGQYRTIDLTRLGFDRIVTGNPMYENNIV